MIGILLNELSSEDVASSSASSASEASSASSAPANGNIFVEFWDKVTNFFANNYWNLLKFIGVLVLGIVIIWIIMSIIKRAMRHREMDPIVINFTCGIIRFCFLLVLVLVLLSTIGVQITGITAAISAAVLAIGMALKDNLSNLANGLILVASKKYKTGDYIVVGSVEGSITEINFLFTTLKTIDGKQVLMPNSTMVNSQVTNLGAYPTRRIELTIPVAYESDVEKVKELILDVMHSDGRVYLDPAPFCALKTLNASSIDFFAHCWVDSTDYWDVYYYLVEHIFNELKREGIVIPYQQIEVRQRNDEVVMPFNEKKLPSRVEKKRVQKKKKLTLEEMEDSSFGDIVVQTKGELKEQKEKAKKARRKKKEKQAESEEQKQ